MIPWRQPAGVAGPVIGWMRWSLFLPMLAAMLVSLRGGGLAGWGVRAMVLACAAAATASAVRVPWRRALHIGFNLWFALTLFLMEVLWDGIIGAWPALAAGILGACALFAADWMARWGLARLPAGGPKDGPMGLWFHSGPLAGFVVADMPVLLSLANGKGVMLRPGYRYVWWVSARGWEPDEIGAVASTGPGDRRPGGC